MMGLLQITKASNTYNYYLLLLYTPYIVKKEKNPKQIGFFLITF